MSMTVFVTQSQHVLATKKYVSMSMTVFVTQSRHLLATKQHVSMTVFVTQSQHVFATKHHVSMTSLTWSFCHQSCYFDFPPFPPLAVLTADQSKLTATYHEIDFFVSSDVEKMHAPVAKGTFGSENVQNTAVSEHFLQF